MHPILARIREKSAPLLLLAGAGLAALICVAHLPRERRVELRLPDAASVTGVEVAWASVAAGGEAIQGSTWHFAAGGAPAGLAAAVRLPDGRYTLDVTVERGAEREAFHRVITLRDTDRVTVRLR